MLKKMVTLLIILSICTLGYTMKLHSFKYNVTKEKMGKEITTYKTSKFNITASLIITKYDAANITKKCIVSAYHDHGPSNLLANIQILKDDHEDAVEMKKVLFDFYKKDIEKNGL